MPSYALIRRVLGVGLVAVLLAAVAAPASAHSSLLSSDPEDGATVDTLDTIRLEFSEDLLEIGNSITIVDGAGEKVKLDVTRPKDNVLKAEVPALAPGELTITWRNASVDGHTEKGEFTVTLLAPPPEPSPTPSPTPSETAAPSPTPVPSPSVTPTAETGQDEDGGVSPWLFGALGLVVIGGAAAALIAATRRPASGD